MKMKEFFFGLIFATFIADLCHGYHQLHKDTAGHWSYDGDLGPKQWRNLKMPGNECGKRHQSPINIISKSATQSSRELAIVNHNATFKQSTLLNNGHNANLILNYQSATNKPALKITYANGTSTRYEFNSLHFQFGTSSDHGSEHRIDGKTFPMEMHSVYFRPEYDSFNNSLKHVNGVVVLATLYKLAAEVEDEEVSALSLITSKLEEVINPNTNTIISEIYLQDLFPKNLNGYYKYHGSLTTPPCPQAVKWYVLKEKVPVTEEQLEQFRQLLKKDVDHEDEKDEGDTNHVADNIRPIQPLNDRTIYTHY